MAGVLAIDHGERKSGFAAADALRIAVRPLGTLRHEGSLERLFAHVDAFLAEHAVETLLVGRPLHMNGAPGPREDATQAFAAALGERYPDLRVVLWDERLTTKEAEALLREEGLRGRAVGLHKDAWAALVLLRDWIASGEPMR